MELLSRIYRLLRALRLVREESPINPVGYWCVAANVVIDKETAASTKRFKPGAKVYFLDSSSWCVGSERVVVVGRVAVVRNGQNLHEYITVTVPAKDLTNWRVDLVYSPRVVEELKKHSDFGKFEAMSPDAKLKAEQTALSFNQAAAR